MDFADNYRLMWKDEQVCTRQILSLGHQDILGPIPMCQAHPEELALVPSGLKHQHTWKIWLRPWQFSLRCQGKCPEWGRQDKWWRELGQGESMAFGN